MSLPFTRLGRAMFATIPRAAGTALGAGAAIEGSRGNLGDLVSEAEAAEDPVKSLHVQMRDAGYYRGPIEPGSRDRAQEDRGRAQGPGA
jgi:hypothetical protein